MELSYIERPLNSGQIINIHMWISVFEGLLRGPVHGQRGEQH